MASAFNHVATAQVGTNGYHNLKMKKVLNVLLALKNNGLQNRFNGLVFKKSLHSFNFDSNEEIIENHIGKIMLIGINIPDRKNLLTEAAVTKLYQSLKNFQVNEELCVAILHGMGGNFCTGVDHTEKALAKAQEIIQVIHKGKKPILGSLEGYTKNFGFHLAIMCDLKVMDETAMVGFGNKNERTEISALVCERLTLTVGFSHCAQLVLMNESWNAQKAEQKGFSNLTVTCGSALSQATCWAQSITLGPKEYIYKERHKIYSQLERRIK